MKKDKFDDIKKKMKFSPAGDGYGSDNFYINFSYNETSMDLLDIIDEMEELKK